MNSQISTNGDVLKKLNKEVRGQSGTLVTLVTNLMPTDICSLFKKWPFKMAFHALRHERREWMSKLQKLPTSLIAVPDCGCQSKHVIR